MTKQLFILLGVLFASISLANAHQQKESYSEILVNERSGNLEISHRFYIHDAGHAIGRILAKMQNTNKPKLSRDWQNDPVSQQYFADYLGQHFFLRQPAADDLVNQPLQLNLVGFEVEGKYFWVYQETAIPKDFDGLEVKMTSLQDIWSKQTNHVNLKIGKQVTSTRLKAKQGWSLLKK